MVVNSEQTTVAVCSKHAHSPTRAHKRLPYIHAHSSQGAQATHTYAFKAAGSSRAGGTVAEGMVIFLPAGLVPLPQAPPPHADFTVEAPAEAPPQQPVEAEVPLQQPEARGAAPLEASLENVLKAFRIGNMPVQLCHNPK